MSYDVSGVGSIITIIADKTLPQGYPLSQFAEDVDPFDFPSVQIGNAVMGANGDGQRYATAVMLPWKVSAIVGSPDDTALQTIAKANLVGKGKASVDDEITVVAIYPDGTQATLTGGKITEAMFGKGMAGTGRLKTRVYGFLFENIIGG